MLVPSPLSPEFNEEFVRNYDELPLWSAPFGLLLLDHVPLKPTSIVLDVGCGTGFPLTALAGRLGPDAEVYGIDPWQAAVLRAEAKVQFYGLKNVKVICADAAAMDFPDKMFDLVVSNLGLNNFSSASVVAKECLRVLKPGGRLCITTNLNGHMRQVYDALRSVFKHRSLEEKITELDSQESRRGTVTSIQKMLTDAGFTLGKVFERQSSMRFANGNALLNSHFVRFAFFPSWWEVVPESERLEVFRELIKSLDAVAESQQGLTLDIPMAYIEVIRPI